MVLASNLLESVKILDQQDVYSFSQNQSCETCRSQGSRDQLQVNRLQYSDETLVGKLSGHGYM